LIIILGTLRIQPDRLDAARPIMAKMVDASRKESGCLHYSYGEDVLEAGLIRISEIWADQQAFDWHISSTHIREWPETWPKLGIGERHLTLYHAHSPRPT
jgi:quinol monooxygenase YgiN